MKNLTALFFLILLSSCQVFEDDKEDLPRVEGYEKVVVIDDCEYIEYKSTFYCGHQYSHHEYRAALLTHKGNCKNHDEQNRTLYAPKAQAKRGVEF
jgi:hypothetical protein